MPQLTIAASKEKLEKSPIFNSGNKDKRIIPVRFQMMGLALNLLSHINIDLAASIISNIWFTVFKSKVKPWTTRFWQQAEDCIQLQLQDTSIPVYLWGEGPLVVMMHGWSGSGSQFRKLIPGLVKAGYKVAAFDAPAHGSNPGKKSNLLAFCDSLVAIQEQLGEVDTVMAHSFGGMAALYATQRGLNPGRMILFGPHLDAHEMHQTYSELLKLNPKLSNRFREMIEQKMQDILEIDNVWTLLTPESLLGSVHAKGLLIYDLEDEEISQQQFKQVAVNWKDCETIETQGLGHHRILKDRRVINDVLAYMGNT